MHHKYFECNYADGAIPLDKLFGTFHNGSEEAQKKCWQDISLDQKNEIYNLINYQIKLQIIKYKLVINKK